MNVETILRKLSNPFDLLSIDEKSVLKEVESSVKKDIKEFCREAKELYQDKRYEKLRNEFKKIYEQNLRLIIYFDCEDVNKYLFKMREYQVQLRTLKSIFDTPEGFIKKDEEINDNKSKRFTAGND